MKKVKKTALFSMLHPKFRGVGLILLTIGSLLCHDISCLHSSKVSPSGCVEIYFSPDDPCMDIIISNISSAKKTILVQAYVITSQKIVTSLI